MGHGAEQTPRDRNPRIPHPEPNLTLGLHPTSFISANTHSLSAASTYLPTNEEPLNG